MAERPPRRLAAAIGPDVEHGGRRLERRRGEVEPVDAGDLEPMPDDGRPGPAHRLWGRYVLVRAPLEARVEVGVEAMEIRDGLVERGACRAPRLAGRRAAAEEACHGEGEEVPSRGRGAP